MKFSEIEQTEWDELKPFLDTCLLPVTGMTGSESPFEATKCLEDLRDMMDLIEEPFHGRVVTYPALHYVNERLGTTSDLDSYCKNLKLQGFKYVVLITAKLEFQLEVDGADLWLSPNPDGELPSQQEIHTHIRQMWNS